MFKKLLVPLDLSSLAEQALGQATAIARASGAVIDLVVVHRPLAFGGFDDAPWNAQDRDAAHRYLERLAAELTAGSGVPTTHDVMTGEPAEKICHRARDVGADLVVMTTHGRTGFSRAWIGSVADAVLRHSPTPVLMLRPMETKSQRTSAHKLFSHVLIPVNGSTFSAEVFPCATALAKCNGARVALLHVVEPIPLMAVDGGLPYPYPPPTVDNRSTQMLADDARDRMTNTTERLRDATGLAVDGHVEVGTSIAHTIIDFARTHDVDVIAMSTHGRGSSRLLMGSVADKVLRGSELPVLFYHPTGIRNDVDPAARDAELASRA
jgi:nucleotide-binding universal stress UspA family protein